MYAFVRGPLALIAFVVFFVGIVIQVVRFFRMTEKKGGVKAMFPQPRKDDLQSLRAPEDIRKKARLRGTVLGMTPYMAVITTIFHLLLILTPILLLPHNLLIEMSWGFRPPSLAESTTDVLTVIILGFGLFFLLRRLISAKVRSLTTPYDYLIFLIVFLPFITGFLAYHQLGDYNIMILLHILTSELMLICIPFTKLVHMIFFFLYRFFLSSEYGFGQGSRVWR